MNNVMIRRESAAVKGKLLAAAVHAGRSSLLLLDRDGRIQQANWPACDLLGVSEPGLAGSTVWDLVHPDDRGWNLVEFVWVLTGVTARVRQKLRLMVHGGHYVSVELTLRRTQSSGEDHVAAVAMLKPADDRSGVGRTDDRHPPAEELPPSDLLTHRRFRAELDGCLREAVERGGSAEHGALLILQVDEAGAGGDISIRQARRHALLTTASVLCSHVRASDVIARVGVDEFAVLLRSADEAQAVATAIILLTDLHGHSGDDHTRLTLSIGIAMVPSRPPSAPELIAQAYEARYAVTRAGGDGYALAAVSGSGFGGGADGSVCPDGGEPAAGTVDA